VNKSAGARILRHRDRVVIEIHSQHGHDPVNLMNYRQSTQWHEMLLAGPVPNFAGVQGNSFPGIYYYHPESRTQWVVMVDGPVDWRECKLGISPRKAFLRKGVLELGLFSTGLVGQDVNLKVSRSEIGDLPNEWQAIKTLAAESFALLPLPKPPDFTPDWTDLASRCLTALKSNSYRHPLSKKLRAVAYRSIVNQQESMYSRPKPYIELITQASIARALHQGSQDIRGLDGTPTVQKLVNNIIPLFFNAEFGIFTNDYSAASTPGSANGVGERKRLVIETWYSLSNLSDIIYLSRAFPRAELRELAAQAVSTWIELGKDCGYLFPLFLDVPSRAMHGDQLNIAVSGLYADVMLSAASLWPRRADEFKAEAAEALTVMRRFPVQRLFHQPELFARAAESSFLLSADDSSFENIGNDFLHALLLMMYRDPLNAGLFEGCAGMMYPTFRESVASLVALARVGGGLGNLPIDSIRQLGLSRCYRFLKHFKGGMVLPSEGLATKEAPNADRIGDAVYAAGGVFDLARMQKW
jgi:hypothetical protein